MSKARMDNTKAGSKDECVRVVIRCRPMSNNEQKDNRECVVQMNRDKGEVAIFKPGDDNPKLFTFDCVYDWNAK